MQIQVKIHDEWVLEAGFPPGVEMNLHLQRAPE